jgi:hypothetical protein
VVRISRYRASARFAPQRIANMTNNDLKFIALNRETELAKRVTCSGLTALRKATPTRPGLYYDAFFGISIGLERFAKLAWLIDEWIASGAFPTNNDLKEKGHNIQALLTKATVIRTNQKDNDSVSAEHATLPSDSVTISAISFLSNFAEATRYFNIDFMVGGKSKQMGDPIRIWHSTVGAAVLGMPKVKAKSVHRHAQAAAIGRVMTPAIVIATSAEGTPLENVSALAMSELEAMEINKQAQWKILGIVRFLGLLLIDLSAAANAAGHCFVPDLREHLGFFCGDDPIIRRYKRWPPAGIT